jgi:DNA-binding Lrp family transcriptional regulator
LIKLVDSGHLKEMKDSLPKILVALISHIGKDGWAEIDQETLAKETGLHRRWVIYLIPRARAMGLIIIDRRKGNRYSLGFEGRPKLADLFRRMVKEGVLLKLPWGYVKLLLVLYRHRNEEGFVFLSMQLLAEEAGVSLSTARRFLRQAKAAGLIEIQRGKNSHPKRALKAIASQSPEVSRRRTNTYRVTFGEGANLYDLIPPMRHGPKRQEKKELPKI